MFFRKSRSSLSRKAGQPLLALAISGATLAQGAVAFASEGDGEAASGYNLFHSRNTVTVTETSQTVNGVSTEHNGTLDVVYGGGNVENAPDVSQNNTVSISGGTMTAVFGGVSGSGNATNNTVTITDGIIKGGVAGGVTFFSYGAETVAGDVIGNKVVVEGGQVGHVSGGEVAYSYPSGKSSTPDLTQSYFSMGGNASRNNVTVTGGTVTGGIVGGASLTGSSTDNTIEIKGGTVSGDVIAGEVRYPTAGSSVTGNSITVSGSPDLSGATLKGGVMGGTDSPTGNSLNISTKNLQAQNISGFQNLNFDLPSDTQSGDTVLLLTSSNGTDLSDMDIRIGKRWDSGINNLSDSTISLIQNNNGAITVNSGTKLSQYFYDGVTLQYPLLGGGLSSDGHSYTASLGSPLVNPATQSTTASITVPSIMINEQTVHMPDPDPDRWDYEPVDEDSNKAEGKDEKPVAMSISPFFDISGGSMREKTGYGSYIDVDSVGMDAGVAFARNNASGRLVFAPVVDYGKGSYTTYLSDGTKGNGDSKYWASGMIVRQIFNSGLYCEGSLRAGRADVDFSSDELRNEGDPAVSFNSSASVLTGHIRIGKVLQYGPSNVHIYGLYTHTRQGSMDADLSTGEHYRFSTVNNGRLRVGARLTWQKNKNQRLFTELAYQYARNGDASASCDGFDIPKSGQNGSSGMLQIGWQIRPNPSTPWALNLSATGWIGAQKGVSAQARITKSF